MESGARLDYLPEGQNPGFDAPEPDDAGTKPDPFGLRDWLLIGTDMPRLSWRASVGRKLDSLAMLIWYGGKHPARGKRRIPVDVDALVGHWLDVLAGLARAHRPEEFDLSDFETDAVLTPLLTAPVAQLREFGTKLVSGMERDERIPYLVWRPYADLVRKSLGEIQKDSAVELKATLARQIAEAVEDDLKPQLLEALVGALQWRSPESLEKVKRAVDSGVKPKFTGRQSCLFLSCGGVMVQL